MAKTVLFIYLLQNLMPLVTEQYNLYTGRHPRSGRICTCAKRFEKIIHYENPPLKNVQCVSNCNTVKKKETSDSSCRKVCRNCHVCYLWQSWECFLWECCPEIREEALVLISLLHDNPKSFYILVRFLHSLVSWTYSSCVSGIVCLSSLFHIQPWLGYAWLGLHCASIRTYKCMNMETVT